MKKPIRCADECRSALAHAKGIIHRDPRVRHPVLLVDGKYDFFFPKETSQDPFFNALGTPAMDKRHAIYEAGHVPPNDILIREVLDWLDYLRPVK